LVNRHRIEVYLLDAGGRLAASFRRIHWDEGEVVGRAVEMLFEEKVETAPVHSTKPADASPRGKSAATLLGTLASLGVAFFPKCPICWAAYLSLFGIASLQRIPYTPWLQPLLVAVMLINVGSLWLRGRATGRMGGFYLVSAGALTILLAKLSLGWEGASVLGIGLTLAGSLLSAVNGGGLRAARN
jgi:protein SCO1/2